MQSGIYDRESFCTFLTFALCQQVGLNCGQNTEATAEVYVSSLDYSTVKTARLRIVLITLSSLNADLSHTHKYSGLTFTLWLRNAKVKDKRWHSF